MDKLTDNPILDECRAWFTFMLRFLKGTDPNKMFTVQRDDKVVEKEILHVVFP